MQQLPALADDLIRLLDKWYPEHSPDPDTSEREVWMQAGERRLVRRLLENQAAAERRE